MSKKYKEYKGLNLTETATQVQEKWKTENTFEQSVASRDASKPFVFFEGPRQRTVCQVFTM